MKKLHLVQTMFFTLFLCFFAINSAFSQTDIVEKVKKLPAANGTYHLTTIDGEKYYGVKKDGKIVEIVVKGKSKTERVALPENENDFAVILSNESAPKFFGSKALCKLFGCQVYNDGSCHCPPPPTKKKQ